MRMAEIVDGKIEYRDMSAAETAEYNRIEAELLPPEPTPEERIAALEVLTDDIVLFMADLIGG